MTLEQLYKLATDETFSLDARYATARQMQEERRKVPVNHTARYTEHENALIPHMTVDEAMKRFNRTREAIHIQRHKLRRKQA